MSGLVLRLASSTSSPSLKTRQRKPSHLGSKLSPPCLAGSGTPLTLDDVEALKAATGVAGAAPTISAQATITLGETSLTADAVGTTVDRLAVDEAELAGGSWSSQFAADRGLRVAVLGTGGLSHSIGEPTMGWIDEEFDHSCIEHFEDGEDTRLAAFLTDALPRTGNGKVQKFTLRERGVGAGTWDRGAGTVSTARGKGVDPREAPGSGDRAAAASPAASPGSADPRGAPTP